MTTYHHPVPLSRSLGTLTPWNPLGHSGPVTRLLYLVGFIIRIKSYVTPSSKCNQKAFFTPTAKRRTCFYSLTYWCPTLAQNRPLFNLIIVEPYCQFHLQSAKYTVLINLSPDYTLDLHWGENRHECLCAFQFASEPNFISWEQKYRNETNMLSVPVIRFSNFEPIHRVSWTPVYVLRDQRRPPTSNFEICTAWWTRELAR